MRKIKLFFFPENDNRINYITTIVTIGLLLIHLVIIVSGYSQLPAIIPTHYNIHGKVDGYGPKDNTIIEFIISGVIFTLLSFLIQSKLIYRNYKGNPEDFGKMDPVVGTITKRILIILRIVVVSIFLIIGMGAFL